MVKKWLHKATYRVAILLIFAILFVIFRSPTVKATYDLPEGIRPGGYLADLSPCKGNPYEPIFDCNQGLYWYSATQTDRLITSVYLDLANENLTIGDLMVTYGTPDGSDLPGKGLFKVVYWGNQAAVVYSKFLTITPHSRVLGILWIEHRQTLIQWEGFYR